MSSQHPDQPTLETLVALGHCADGQPRIGELLAELRGLPVREWLEQIAWDDTRSLSCYSADLAVCTAGDLNQLDAVTCDRLLTKLHERKKGPWHKLAKRLGLTANA